jgi:predicted nucleic acid-binding protein
MKIVLDTNIVLSSISRKSPYHDILKTLFYGFYDLYLTTEILLEYEEKITSNFDADLAQTFISALLIKSNIKKNDI